LLKTAKDHYRLKTYPHFIEFYLSEEIQTKGFMTGLLPNIISFLNHQGIENLAAVVHRKNTKDQNY